MKFKEMINVWKKVFSDWRYIFLTIFVTGTFYILNALVSNLESLPSFYSSLGLLGTVKLFFIMLWNFGSTVKLHSYISLIIISLLFGILFSLISYKTIKIKANSEKVGIVASIGIFIGILAPGCAACGIGLLSLFGLSAAFLTFLPFEGLELSILSIGLLLFSVIKISNIIHRGNTCEIKTNKNERRFKK